MLKIHNQATARRYFWVLFCFFLILPVLSSSLVIFLVFCGVCTRFLFFSCFSELLFGFSCASLFFSGFPTLSRFFSFCSLCSLLLALARSLLALRSLFARSAESARSCSLLLALARSCSLFARSWLLALPCSPFAWLGIVSIFLIWGSFRAFSSKTLPVCDLCHGFFDFSDCLCSTLVTSSYFKLHA